MPKKHKPKLSALQSAWLNQRYDDGRNVAVLVGSPEGIAIYEDKAWDDQKSITQLYSRIEIAQWITDKVAKEKS